MALKFKKDFNNYFKLERKNKLLKQDMQFFKKKIDDLNNDFEYLMKMNQDLNKILLFHTTYLHLINNIELDPHESSDYYYYKLKYYFKENLENIHPNEQKKILYIIHDYDLVHYTLNDLNQTINYKINQLLLTVNQYRKNKKILKLMKKNMYKTVLFRKNEFM